MKHNNNFDFLRFLFSFLVVIGHSLILSGKPEFWNDFLAAMPNYSVYSFFVISGFLIYSSFDRLKNIKIYAKNRAKRILPAYFFTVIFFAIILFGFSTTDIKGYFSLEWIKYLFANLTFANFLKPCIPFVFSNNTGCAVNGSLWTIKVEIMFYAFIPILYYFLNKKTLKTKNVILVVFYLLSFTYSYFIEKHFSYEMSKQLPGSLKYFIIGILLYLNFDFFTRYKMRLLFYAIIMGILEFYFFPIGFFFPLFLGVVIIWFAFSKVPLQNFGKYGDFSYGMYLIHFPIIQIFVQEKVYDRYSFMGLIASYIVIIIFSIVLWKLIESPFLRKRKTIV